MGNTSILSNASDLSLEDYCVFGLATCFVRDEGEVKEIEVIEPIPSSALEALLKGIPTSYQWAIGLSLSQIWVGENLNKPSEFPGDASFGEDFLNRTIAAARTYKRNPERREYIPLGTKKEDFNYSTERKRVLNVENIVKTEDNVKQHSYTHQVL